MSTSQSAIDDLLDTRAEIRELRKQLLQRKIAYQECKAKLTAAATRLEDVLTELEQRQGRLPFAEDDAPQPAARPSNGRGRKQKAAMAGQSNWKAER